MSIHVISWVLEHSDERLGRRLVLLVLADHAKKDGSNAWPSIDTIAHEARMSRAQVIRCLSELRASGAIVEKGKSRAGTKVYDVVMGSQYATVGGSQIGQNGSRRMRPEPSLEQPSEVLAAAPRARPRNELWDALEHIFGPASTRQAQQVRGKVVSGLALAGATPAEINARARRWRLHFEGATMTELALEKHWDTLPRRPLK